MRILIGNLKDRGTHLEDIGIDWRIVLQCILKTGWEGWTGLIGIRMQISGGFLRAR
jgi:hypothetical protein